MAADSTKSFVRSSLIERTTVPCLLLEVQGGSPVISRRLINLGQARVVTLARGEGNGLGLHWTRDAVTVELPDRFMSSKHLELVQRGGRWKLDDLKSKNGVYLNGEPTVSAEIEDGDCIELGSTVLFFKSALETEFVDAIVTCEAKGEAVATYSPAVTRLLRDIERIARSELPVLLEGETGTGKELAARRVHELSGRPGAFVAVNCAAIAAQLSEAELFGHVKGAFTDAAEDRAGLVRASSGGTLFLDEIAELSPGLQSKLLRVLQEREVQPVGSDVPVKVDLRVVGASWRNLDELVKKGAFRHDLLARLSGYHLTLPPLRSRREDIGALMATFLQRQLGDGAKTVCFERKALRAFFAYEWPNNVRELERAIQRATALSRGELVTCEHLPPELLDDDGAGDAADDGLLRSRLEQALLQHAGSVSAVARDFGKERNQIRRWCRRLGIDLEHFRASSSRPAGSP